MIAHCVVLQTESTLFRFPPDSQTQVVCRVPLQDQIQLGKTKSNMLSRHSYTTLLETFHLHESVLSRGSNFLRHVKQCNNKQTEKADRACGTQVDRPVLPCSMFYLDGAGRSDVDMDGPPTFSQRPKAKLEKLLQKKLTP